MQTDPLSDVLRVVRLSGAMFIRLRLSAPYALDALDAGSMRAAFAPDSARVMPFHLITAGPIWIRVAGEEPVRLEEGDIIVLPHGTSHALASADGAEASKPVSDYHHLIDHDPPMLVWDGPGEEAKVLCGFFTCQGRLFNPLVEALPSVVVIRHSAPGTPWLVANLERTFNETLGERRGGAALIESLTSLLFMDVVQRYVDDQSPGGWFAGLADPVVGQTLQNIHGEPGHGWTVDELARRAGVSRSILADRFVQLVGVSPIKYLTAWRMELAASRMLESSDSLAEIAADVGYESESSFSKAFKRHVGDPPAGWRRAHRAAHATAEA